MRSVNAGPIHTHGFARTATAGRVSVVGTVGGLVPREEKASEVVAGLDVPMSHGVEVKRQAWWDAPAKAAVIVLTVLTLGSGAATGTMLTLGREFFAPGLQSSFWWMITVYSAIMYAALVWRIWLWARYRPMASASDAELPRVTVVIPAYNEGELVRQSILSAARSRYPADKLQIIVVDDGSTDDTWSWIEKTVRELETTINICGFKQPRNMGKRHALFAGFKRAEGDVIVTMDSDSIFAPDSLRNAVTPVVRDPRIGCVAGCVEVMNPYDSIWTRFLKTTFTLSFKFVRAYQNQFRGVFCTPGALSVYRADVVRKFGEEWLHQTFLGKPCLTGEDRAMTNLFLREGYLTAYQENAKVFAKMPDTYKGMTKMLLRWARSNIRETIILQKFLHKLDRDYATPFKINMWLVLSTLIVPYILIWNSAALIAMHPAYLLRHFGMLSVFAITMAIIAWRCDKDSDSLWQLAYEMFWVLGFAWIMPWAALTLRNTGWLTRGNSVPIRPRGDAAPLASPGLLPAHAA